MATNKTEDVIARIMDIGPWFWDEESDKEPQALGKLRSSRKAFQNALGAAAGAPHAVISGLLSSQIVSRALACRHAMIATDLSCEMVDRARLYVRARGIASLTVSVDGGAVTRLPLRALPTHTGKLSTKAVDTGNEALHHDILAVALYAGFSQELNYPTFRRCLLGAIAGNPSHIEDFFQGLYLSLSGQLRGRGAVNRGKEMQKTVIAELERRLERLGVEFTRTPASRLPSAVGPGLQYDAVYKIGEPARAFVTVEVAFQETTNSVIERKAKEARGNYSDFQKQGFKSCYVVAGAGWFSRIAALRRLIQNSDLCVSPKEIGRLADFIASL